MLRDCSCVCSYDMSGDGVLGHEECGQMFGSVNKLANAMDANVRKLTPADQESLFEVLDQDNRCARSD